MEGMSLGPYEIGSELGTGGMGQVYAATLTSAVAGLEPGTTVALKVVHPHLLEVEGFFQRFLREADIGATVRHDNVVRTYLADELAGHHFLVMEHVEGQTLAELRRELDTVPEELCRHVGREICKGLAAIHAEGVIHRDMKPDNVLITADHVVKVMDLGVARLADEQMRLSQSGAFIGSVEYAAPEQFEGVAVDGRCDLHAVGLVLYELSSGQHPYRGDSFPDVMRRIREDAPRPLGEIDPQLSPFFEEVVHTLLAKVRADRFQSADELRDVLEDGEESAWWRDRARALRAATQRPLRRIRIPRDTAVYGRDAELAELRALYESAKTGEGCVVVIEGEAGIGKSRLVDELLGRLQQEGEDLNFLFGSYPPGGGSTAAGGFGSAYRAHLGEAGSAAYLGKTPILVPAFDALLAGAPAPAEVHPLTADSLATCFVNVTRALAAERTTVVLIEDLHFAPDEGRGLFSTLAMAAPGHRVLLVGTTRPGVDAAWLSSVQQLRQTRRMSLGRLGHRDLAALLEDSFKSEDLALGLAGQIGVKSDGNPFFAFEIIRGLREGQFIAQRDDGTWMSTKVIEDIEIPSSVLDLVNARVSDLTEDERNLLDVAACWGFEFDPLLVGAVLGTPQIPLMRSLARIEKKHRLVRSAGRHFVFDHHQVQEALYSALPVLLREPYHAALADALELRTHAADTDPALLDGALCVDLCDHYLKGASGESARRYLAAAQTHLSEGYLHAQVAALTERALAVPHLVEGTERGRALLRLCGALHAMGRRERQEDAAREAEHLAEEAGDDTLRAQAARALGLVFADTARNAEAEVALERALDISLCQGDARAEAEATRTLGNVLKKEGRLTEAREHHERALAISRRIADKHGEAAATAGLGVVAKAEGRLAEARQCYERSLALSRETGDRAGEVASLGNLGTVFRFEGHVDEAREHYAQALSLSREIGDRASESSATSGLAAVCWSEGRLAEAQAHNERHLELSREIGGRVGEALATGNLGVVCFAQGRLTEARQHYERQLALCREIGDRRDEALAIHNLANVYREEGEPRRAEELLLSCLTLCVEFGYRHVAAATHRALGAIRVAAGDDDGARTSLTVALDLAAEIGVTGVETLAQCYLACLPDADPAPALAALTENADRLDAAERREAHFLLWRATGDTAHLAAAKRLLDEAVAHADDDTRASMLTNLVLNRDIEAAWRTDGGG